MQVTSPLLGSDLAGSTVERGGPEMDAPEMEGPRHAMTRRSMRLSAAMSDISNSNAGTPLTRRSRGAGRCDPPASPRPECIRGSKAAHVDESLPLCLETLTDDAKAHIATFLRTPNPSPLVALATTGKSFRECLREPVEAERSALTESLCTKLLMDEPTLTSTTEIYGQRRDLTDGEGVMLAYLLLRSGALARLSTMWLFSNRLGDGTCRAFARAFRLQAAATDLSLRSLWLSDNRIGSAGAAPLPSPGGVSLPTLPAATMVNQPAPLRARHASARRGLRGPGGGGQPR